MGFFITFEGIEGCGKSTQLELLKAHLEKKGRAVLSVREPGGTLLGERVRSVLLNGTEEGVDPWAELFLYEACRAQLVTKVIKPALATGKIVLCDRFFDSTLAYQGYGRGLDAEKIKELNALATGGLIPDLTILVDCAEEVGLKRAWARINASAGAREDRFENEELAFHRRVRGGFLAIAEASPRVKAVDGSREISTVHREICDIIEGVAGL